MGVGKRRKLGFVAAEWIVFLIALTMMYPLYLVLINSVKPLGDIITNAIALPGTIVLDNYANAWDALHFPTALTNSVLVTVFSNLGVTIIAALAAYQLVRKSTRFNNMLFMLFIASMVIPFQAVMLPLVKVIRTLGLIDSVAGVVFTYWGLGLAFTIFLFHGYIKTSVPYEIEEAAVIDGCGPLGVFWRTVFPLLKPMAITAVVLNTLWFWNDFLLPNMLLSSTKNQTIQIAINAFFGQFLTRWDLALPALVLGTTPAVAFFLVLQRQIIEGVSSGAVKG